ncbi:hypothetical protein BDY19DRAFT_730973 [Irpex rosettiformis]|uniref:Uncharacterized protein n=1 Tax=Irpex rosettiformis TaxID=378272 RepID=A0ACB8U989_9APHY|nr:hypothetical protein BDY19DRAFT_730973 [Irpex rosettiformis]
MSFSSILEDRFPAFIDAMSGFTPLLSPAKSASGPTSSKGKWRPWSMPVDSSMLSRTLCGYLNKLTGRNFNVIAYRIARLAWAVELSEDRSALDIFVRAVFLRGATDEHRQDLYALLCQRIVYTLETERSLWRKVDILHIGNPFQSFETAITLLVLDEFNRERGSHIPEGLERLMRFVGELLVHGVLASTDVSDILVSLLEGVKRNDEHLAVVTCRFLSPITAAFNTLHILQSLQASILLEQVLKEDGLSPKVRYLMMGMLHRVSYPAPLDSTRQRVDLYYPIALDEYYIDEDDDDAAVLSDGDDSENNEWMQRDCEDWAKAFLLYYDYHHLGDILHSLRPVHRKQLLHCLISAALYSDDVMGSGCVGSLYRIPRIRELYVDGRLFEETLQEELTTLQDVLLDVPNAMQLMAHILYSTSLNATKLKTMIDSSMASQSILAGMLTSEVIRLEQRYQAENPVDEDKHITHEG